MDKCKRSLSIILSLLSFLLLGGSPVLVFLSLCFAQNGVKPATLNMGTIVSYNTTTGRVTRKAIELDVEDVNNDKTFLNETQLGLMMMDYNYTSSIGTIAGMFNVFKVD
ncbi:hypothetical protein SUGI_0668640 [Cryptomeria japonica]|nr:hypothetical protein SUGI_0668350 [Cryptomeria japonica]GLJ33229.1 hypothetical protein SUGI_0668640 [Cryptomeria japonica]